jgi:hypothetical protein
MAAPAIGRRARWAPTVHTQIDRSHPLSAGLVTLWWPGIRVDPVDGKAWTENVATRTAGKFGEARQIAASNVITRPNNPMPLQTGSLLVVQRLNAAPSGNGNGYGHSVNDITARWGAHVPFGDGTIYFDIFNTTTGRLTYAGWTWGNWDVFVFTNGATGGQSIWGNGLRLANDASIAPTRVDAGTWGWGQHASTPNSTAAQCSIIAGWSRELLAGEIAQLTADPFCMLRS